MHEAFRQSHKEKGSPGTGLCEHVMGDANKISASDDCGWLQEYHLNMKHALQREFVHSIIESSMDRHERPDGPIDKSGIYDTDFEIQYRTIHGASVRKRQCHLTAVTRRGLELFCFLRPASLLSFFFAFFAFVDPGFRPGSLSRTTSFAHMHVCQAPFRSS